MNPAFAGPEFGDEFGNEETQLTLGTTSLLSIFFGLVMICGIFFGLGYTFGRRSLAQIAAQKQSPAASSAAKVIAAPLTQPPAVQMAQTTPTETGPRQSTQGPNAAATVALSTSVSAPGSSAASAKLAAPTLIASSVKAPAPNLSAVAKTGDKAASVPSASIPPVKPQVPVSTLLANKTFLPKPSAIQPVLVQPHTNVAYLHGVPMPPNPYEAAQLPWKWTPPFDVVHPSHTRLSHPQESRLASASSTHASSMQTDTAATHQPGSLPSSHAALMIQIAALSRQDDAQVLADSLRKRGFFASIQNGNEDALYHVQMGPLERRTALATQQRLIARGYNAVVK